LLLHVCMHQVHCSCKASARLLLLLMHLRCI
jgi:hypothetical protein